MKKTSQSSQTPQWTMPRTTPVKGMSTEWLVRVHSDGSGFICRLHGTNILDSYSPMSKEGLTIALCAIGQGLEPPRVLLSYPDKPPVGIPPDTSRLLAVLGAKNPALKNKSTRRPASLQSVAATRAKE